MGRGPVPIGGNSWGVTASYTTWGGGGERLIYLEHPLGSMTSEGEFPGQSCEVLRRFFLLKG